MSMQSPTQGTGPDEGDRKRRTEHRKAPKPEAVREVARRLRDAGQRERIEIDLSRTRVVRWTKPPWHTVACHGGSYALARREAVAEGYRLEFRPLEGDALLEYHPDERLSARFGCELWAIDATGEVNHKIHGNRGALALARDLGYEDSEALCQWAHENPRQWGNVRGGAMFYDEDAFDETPETISLKAIAEWWLQVADRLEVEEAVLDGFRAGRGSDQGARGLRLKHERRRSVLFLP